MSIETRLASSLNRRDEKPNIDLAVEIVDKADQHAVKALVDLIKTGKKAVRHDAIKVLYEIGARKPRLIAPFTNDFAALLPTRDNRLKWGLLTALDNITPHAPTKIAPLLTDVLAAADEGSVIAKDRAMSILVELTTHPQCAEIALEAFTERLPTTPANQFPMYCEMFATAHAPPSTTNLSPQDIGQVTHILTQRLDDMPTAAKAKRVTRALNMLHKTNTGTSTVNQAPDQPKPAGDQTHETRRHR